MSSNNPYNLKVGDKVNWCAPNFKGPRESGYELGYPTSYTCDIHVPSCYQVHTIVKISTNNLVVALEDGYSFIDYEGGTRNSGGWDITWFRPAEPMYITKPRNRLDMIFDG